MGKENIVNPDSKQIEAWKKIYGEVYELTVRDKKCYLRKFDRATMSYALSLLTSDVDVNLENKSNPKVGKIQINPEKILKVGEIALQNCWLGGDEEIKTDDSLFVSAAMEAGTLFEMEESSLKKL